MKKLILVSSRMIKSSYLKKSCIISMATEQFREFILTQLKIAKINQKHRDQFTDVEGMKLFLKAVTSPTYSKDNYQELEFTGDGIIKGILSQYIPRRFPGLASGESKYSKKGTGEGVLSKTRRMLEQSKTLADCALKLGFWDFVLADDDTKATNRKKTLEDVFEAFIGALVEIVDQRVRSGLGYAFAYNYVQAALDDIDIDISKKTLDDPITRLNELYKAKELKDGKIPFKWGDAAYNTFQIWVPKLTEKPKSASLGEVIFSLKDKVVYVWAKEGWVHASRAPLIELLGVPPPPLPLNPSDPIEDKQLLWYAGVYGFDNRIGKVYNGFLNGVKPQQIIENPDKYDADIIGQGLHFKKADAKQLAASQALYYLNGKGYKK